MTGFLDLPPEIRNLIYSHMESLIAELAESQFKEYGPRHRNIVDGGNQVYRGTWYEFYDPFLGWFDQLEDGVVFPLQPPIMKVCRQIRSDTIPIFYGTNSFRIRNAFWGSFGVYQVHKPFLEKLADYFAHIKPCVPYLTDVEISCGCGCPRKADEVVGVLISLDLGFKEGVLKAEKFELIFDHMGRPLSGGY